MEHCPGLARSLLEAASIGSDPPLNMPLPHTRVMMATNKGNLLFLQCYTVQDACLCRGSFHDYCTSRAPKVQV